MTLPKNKEDLSAKWKEFAGEESPAGAIFISGIHAQADIVGRTGTGSGKCGTVCSGSIRHHCC